MIEDEDAAAAERPDWRARFGEWLLRHPKDAVALLVAVLGSGAIAVNALWLQSGPHPAPLFSLSIVNTGEPIKATTEMPRPRPAATEPTAATPAPRSRPDLVSEIQRELAKRNFYDGAVDGLYGPKTDTAVRDFAQAAHLKLDAEPTDAVLHSIVHSAVREVKPTPAAISRGRHDAIADLIGPSNRVLAVQRALTNYGYGQIKPTGVLGPDTVAAIEKFERARRLPVTGQVSDRLVRELAALTGRPLE